MDDADVPPAAPPPGTPVPETPALVISVGSHACVVHVPGHGEVRCTLRGALYEQAESSGETRPVAAGDHVRVTLDGSGGVVEEILPRRSRLARPESGGGKRGRVRRNVQVIAANVDRLIVVAALDDPPFRPGLVDRFLVAAASHGLHPLLVLNKVDLAQSRPGLDREVAADYRRWGYDLIATSTVSGEGLDALRTRMAEGISLLVGHSGVGKSSLANAISPGLQLATGAVADYHGRGKHTTTAVTLLPLTGGGWLVDSPGIREFGVADLSPSDLARLYPGFGERPEHCRFNDCLHRNEPGCAVRAALAAGELAAERHESYLRLLAEQEQQARPYAD